MARSQNSNFCNTTFFTMCALTIIIFDPSEIMREGIKQIVSRTNRGFQFLDIFCEPDLLNVLTKKSSPVIFLTLNSAKLNGHRVAISLLKQFKKEGAYQERPELVSEGKD